MAVLVLPVLLEASLLTAESQLPVLEAQFEFLATRLEFHPLLAVLMCRVPTV
jgi:hypothetical protein